MDYSIRDMFDGMEAPDIYLGKQAYSSPGKIKELTMKKINAKNKGRAVTKHFVTIALAAVLVFALSLTAYAVSSIHQKRREELRASLQVQENNVTSYVEYPEPAADQSGVTLLSAISGAEFQTVYVNVSPISEEEAYTCVRHHLFQYSLDGGQSFTVAQVPFDSELIKEEDMIEIYDKDTDHTFKTLDPDKWAEYAMQCSYDKQSQTITLVCDIVKSRIEGMEELELTIMSFGEDWHRSNAFVKKIYGSVNFSPTPEQSRRLNFPEPVPFGPEALPEQGSIAGLELHPNSIKLLFDIPDAENVFVPGGDEDILLAWSNSMDEAMRSCTLFFKDGREIVLAGYISAPIEKGYVCAYTALGATVDIMRLEAVEIAGERIDVNYVN